MNPYPSKDSLFESIDVPINLSQAILQPLNLGFWGINAEIMIQRDDLIHPLISGNKWRKLEGWLKMASEKNANTLITFGGAYSNHLVATAVAAKQHGLKSVGYLRGDEPINNIYLDIAKAAGMEIIGLSRADFREKSALMDDLIKDSSCLVIPEGGQGTPAFLGFEEMVNSWKICPEVIVHASATASTAVGLATALKKVNHSAKIWSVPVLKNLTAQFGFASENGVAEIIQFRDGYHFGGYAKMPTELIEFQLEFQENTQIIIDPVYNAKALWMLRDSLVRGEINANKNLVFLHTGGMLTSYPIN